jgi:hypothetical protein
MDQMGLAKHLAGLKAMGSLLTMLLIGPKLRELNTHFLESFSRKGWALFQEAAKEALSMLLGLLLVVLGVAFFYLYCLPWIGVH